MHLHSLIVHSSCFCLGRDIVRFLTSLIVEVLRGSYEVLALQRAYKSARHLPLNPRLPITRGTAVSR